MANNKTLHKAIERYVNRHCDHLKGMERHGDDCRFRYHGNWYKVVAAKPGMRWYVNLILESVL
ncbi:hypothetical protein NVP1168O_41 [Vibrio phage 1.168.O._10N.261.52.A10]|nr:hypothetical protein NVP1168O_41 [Vibrio phage 1.168.O._10N.261.52.A10]